MAKRRSLSRRTFLRLLGGTLAVGVGLPAEARYIEPYALDVTRHTVPLPGLPPELDGLTVAHLTDLHRGLVTPDAVLADAVVATNALRPDVVVLTGDFVQAHFRDAAPLARMLADLRPRLGMWGCLGNHDYFTDSNKVTSALAAGGVRMLRNAAGEIAPGLWAVGIEDTLRGKPDASAAMATVPADAAALFLTHNPVGVFACHDRPWLALAGHTHGGQICVPFLPTPRPPGMPGFPLLAGWGVFDQARLYVNRGVGMGMLPMRFRCRPEVALFTLRCGEGLPGPDPGLATRAFHTARRVAGGARDGAKKVARHAGDAWRRAQ